VIAPSVCDSQQRHDANSGSSVINEVITNYGLDFLTCQYQYKTRINLNLICLKDTGIYATAGFVWWC